MRIYSYAYISLALMAYVNDKGQVKVSPGHTLEYGTLYYFIFKLT